MGEAEERVADMEEWATNAKEALCHAMHMQESIQAKLTDLEARSEGDNMQYFIESFIQSELSLRDTELGIQCCHRALGPKPLQSANHRSVVIYFLEYIVKEQVLRSAWKKREVHLNGVSLF